KQHPNTDVSEYLKLAPQAREDAKPPKETPHLTPGQKVAAATRYQTGLAAVERERRARQGGTFFDPRSQQLLPAMSDDELNERKQELQNSYESELAAGGDSPQHYDYATGQFADQGVQPNASTSDRVRVISPDGTSGSIPRSQLGKAKKRGYK